MFYVNVGDGFKSSGFNIRGNVNTAAGHRQFRVRERAISQRRSRWKACPRRRHGAFQLDRLQHGHRRHSARVERSREHLASGRERRRDGARRRMGPAVGSFRERCAWRYGRLHAHAIRRVPGRLLDHPGLRSAKRCRRLRCGRETATAKAISKTRAAMSLPWRQPTRWWRMANTRCRQVRRTGPFGVQFYAVDEQKISLVDHPHATEPAYSKVDASVTWAAADGAWRVALWAGTSRTKSCAPWRTRPAPSPASRRRHLHHH